MSSVNRLKWIYRLLLGINILFGLFFLFALLAVYVNPQSWWLPALAGLSFLPIFGVNLLFFTLWLFIRRKYSLYSLVFLIFGLTELPNHIQLNFNHKPGEKDFKILSLNVRNFDLYNWSDNKKTRDKILNLIEKRNANIICLQEFFNTTDPAHQFKTLDTILQFENHYWSHVEYTTTVKGTEHWGIATFTTFPVVNKGRVYFSEKTNNTCIFTDVLIERDTFRIYNMHLASVRFGQDEYKYLEKVVDRNIDPNVQESMNLLTKLKNGFQHRATQVVEIEKHVKSSPYPVILCGDFNDTPTSFTYYTLSAGLQDSFKARGNGLGWTYNGKLPFLRIDYILTDPSIDILSHEVVHDNISDHYPIFANFQIKKSTDL